jgi:ABC-type sugar transport system permease subunit
MTALSRQMRDFAVAAALAIVVATCAFVGVRNRELIARQLDLAERSAHALRDGKSALPTVHGHVVAPAKSSPKHPFLTRRQVRDPGSRARELGGTGASPDDKLFYDAAKHFDEHGEYVELMRDGTGRAIAAVRSTAPIDSMTRGAAIGNRDAIAIAITDSARPAPFPLLVLIGVLGLGAALAAAGALVGPRAARAGTLAGIAALAVPALLWQAWIAATFIALLACAIALAQRAGLSDRFAIEVRRHRIALGFLAPAAISMLVLVAVPFLIGIALGFYDYDHGTYSFVGLGNFAEILSGGGRALDDPLNFWFILGVTVLWTACNVMLHVTIGVVLALALSRRWLVGKGIYRMLLVLPWAIPNYITALIWKGMFTGEAGAINSILHAFGLSDVSWFTQWSTSFTANVVTNTWLGFPFMMVVALGALETIPRELYEAASVDGASAWQRFRHITLPHLRPALGPAVALGSIWTFNMFNVIYLVSGGKPGDSTNILVTDAYRWAFERGDRYGMAAAEATLIFLILLLWTVFGTRIVRSKAGDA